MIQLTTLARPYAEAAFTWAVQHKQLEMWDGFLSEVVRFAEIPSVAYLLNNPTVSKAQVLQAFHLLLDQEPWDEHCVNFLQILVKNRRMLLLPFIAERFKGLQMEYEGKLKVEIVAAFSLSEAQKDAIIKALEQRYKRRVFLKTKLDSKLLAGAVVRVGNRVLNRSVLTGIKLLAKTLRGEKA